MNPVFLAYLERMKIRFDELEACPPVAFTDDIPSKPGVYLFLEGTAVERVGRSNNLKKRLRSHLQAVHNSGAYAFKRARNQLGLKATYRKGTGRKDLQRDPEFMALFKNEIARLQTLNIRYAIVDDPIEQYLLELYAAIEHNLELAAYGNH